MILPASTVPSDVVLAARFISSSGDPAQVANQPWDDSVKSLARYPDVVKWMDQNLEWTTQVGEAFLDQPADVMNTIQQLRAQAIAAGNLTDCPQQRIVKEESCIRIVPAESEMIYVPQYDPEVVYVQPYDPYLGPALTFGVGFAVGSWLNYDCDWPGRRVCVGDWNPRWRNDWNPGWWNDWNPGWKHRWKRNRGGNFDGINVVSINRDTARIWQPSARIQRRQWQRERNYNDNATAYYNLNARGRRGDGNDPGRRFAAVARPSRLDFNGRAGDGDRRAWRRSNSDVSNLARNLPGEIRQPRAFRGQLPGQSEQLSRGDGNREWKGKGRGKEGYQSNGWQGDNSQARKWRADSSSVKSTGLSPSANWDQSRSHRSKSVHSNANASSQQFKTGRSKSFDAQNTTPSYSKANKHSQSARVERSKGGSQNSGASYSKANKHSQSARMERSRGGSQNSGASHSKANKHSQSARVESSKRGSQNSGASYSKPSKSQSAGATGKGVGGAGGHKSGKKGDGNKEGKGKN